MPLKPGTRFGNYEILAPPGAGGMSEVWLAEDTRLKRKVAVKILSAQLTEDPDRVRRFEREAHAADITHRDVKPDNIIVREDEDLLENQS